MTPYDAGYEAGRGADLRILVSWLTYEDRIAYRAGWMAGMKKRLK